ITTRLFLPHPLIPHLSAFIISLNASFSLFYSVCNVAQSTADHFPDCSHQPAALDPSSSVLAGRMSENRHQRAAAAKNSASWSRKVETELFEHPYGRRKSDNRQENANKQGRWDPYDRFTKEKDVTKFFSGHKYRPCSLTDRERFAKFCIQKTLDGHPDDNFETTGEIMKNESVVDQSDEPETLENLAREIRADGQQDVDAEFKDHGTRSSKADDNDLTQKIGAAAQSIIAASPNSLGPPVNPCAIYLKMTQCGQYGRSNSTIWRSPLIPNLDNEDGRRGLLDHQVTAIVWLLSRLFGDLPTLEYRDPITGRSSSNIQTPSDIENRNSLKGPKYFGGILADSMGLGKTLITVALVDLLISQGLNVIRAEDGTAKHRPILLVAPNATVASQWVQEFCQVIDRSTLHQIIVSGPGLEVPGGKRVAHLERDNFKQWPASTSYVWDENDPRASKVVLIMTMESWAVRTCKYNKEESEWSSTFTEEGRGFSLVIVDEAYKFTLLITATPCMNTLADIFGLARLLWTAPEKYLKQDPTLWKEIEEKFRDLKSLDLLDEYPSSHHFQLVAGRPALLARLLFKHSKARTHDIDLTRQYLRHFETLAMLKRSPSSYIYTDWEKTRPICLEGLFPKVENYTVDISPGEAYDQEYQRVHMDLLIRYLEGLNAWGRVVGRGKRPKKEEEDAKVPVMNSIRILQMASSSLDVYDLDTILSANDHSTRSVEVAKMREQDVSLPRLVQFLVLPTETTPETHVGWMGIALRNSPILRYILRYIDENILTRKANERIKKLLIVEHNPMVAFYYELVLQFLGFECRCMHAQLSPDERQQLIDSFNSRKNRSCQILIQLYTVGFAGTNLHMSCSRVLVASQSHSLPVQWQAIHRVIRVGQNSDVTVHRVKLKNSYHAFQESRQIEKILPELGGRAQGNTKKVLVRLLNLFQYEVNEAWHSPEGQKLRLERNLLDDDSDKEADSPAFKQVKLGTTKAKVKFEKKRFEEAIKKLGTINVKVKIENKRIKEEEVAEAPAPKRIKISINSMTKIEDIKKEEEEKADFSGSLFISNETQLRTDTNSSSKKRKGQEAIVPRTGDGSGGWYNGEEEKGVSDDAAFLALRTRDTYYAEYIELPREARSVFSHPKNNLRRLLSYGNDEGMLSTVPWKEVDLENPAVLERALEVMLRVRLGAKDIAMLPFPMIDLSRASAPRRAQLQQLLAKTRYTDQDLHGAAGAAGKDPRETLRGTDLNKPLAKIEQDLEDQARFGDGSCGYGVKEVARMAEKSCVNLPDDVDPPRSSSSAGRMSEAAEGEVALIGDIDEDEDEDEDEITEGEVILIDDTDEDEDEECQMVGPGR
ncbi:P-loop containing nucleoside triphosphate hydrolase protein, partial [Ustulina deusta]